VYDSCALMYEYRSASLASFSARLPFL
jgi:hypothetical protein